MNVEDLIGRWAGRAHVTNWRAESKKHKHRCVYVLECKGSYKIGMTGDLENRMKGIQAANPFGVQLAHVIFTEDHSKVEKALHGIFAVSRENNEWFHLSLRDLAAIKSMSVQEILHAAEQLKPKIALEPTIPPDQMTFKW